jgi:hypothetical protein
MSDADDDVPRQTAVGEGNYEVQQGDCLSSIAARFGFTWQTLWNLPENAELKCVRKNPNVLLPGDRLTIPDLRPNTYDCVTDRTHKFVLTGVPVKFVLAFLEDGEPRTGDRYALWVEGRWRNGVLDSKGRLTELIPPGAKTGRLILNGKEEIPLVFGSLDPVTEVSGIQGRLLNLGFSPGPVDGIWGPKTASALRDFQKSRGLKSTGRLNDTTRSELVEAHGS